MTDLPAPPAFKGASLRPGDAWPDLSGEKYVVLSLIAGETTPPAFDEHRLAQELKRSCGVFLAVGEPEHRWKMKAVYKVMSEAHLPALVIIVECTAMVDIYWFDLIARHSRCLCHSEARPPPSLPHTLNRKRKGGSRCCRGRPRCWKEVSMNNVDIMPTASDFKIVAVSNDMTAEITPSPLTQPPGASEGDWSCFDLVLGLTNDLLPVVCNTAAKISPRSNLKPGHIGRVPCWYDRDGDVMGIPRWTDAVSTGKDIDRWASEGDYGICVITRHARGLDLDVTNEALVSRIAVAIEAHVGPLPTRRREGTAKRLMMVKVEGDLGKRRLQVEGGEFIEFLGTGQMFVAAGSRADGSRYYWEGGLPVDIPEISVEQFEAVWQALVDEFGTADPVVSGPPGEARPDKDVEDPVADWLTEQGRVRGERPRGLVVECPWADEHTGGETGDGSTMWMFAGGKGHEIGHFKCMHAHCSHRTRSDYLAAVGYKEDLASEFDDLTATDGDAVAEEVEESLPGFEREKDGSIKAIINNVVKGVASRKCAGMVVAYDEFRDEIMWGPGGSDGWQRFTDVDYTRLQMKLERWGFKPISKEILRSAVEEVALRNAFDSAITWLREKVPAWDGVPRIETFLSDYWGVEDTPYTRGVSLYLWTALAGRVLKPGCKADMVPIFVGPQGCGKSTGVAALAPTEEVFTEISLHEKDDNLSRRLRGQIVVELSELQGLRTRELETIKAWITKRRENWVPKYKEFPANFWRRCILFGTTNQDQFLADATGNRRWLPVKVGRISSFMAVREQLWAEARGVFLEKGVQFRDAEQLAGDAHEEHTIVDPREDAIHTWLNSEDELGGGKPGDRSHLTTSEVALHALSVDLKRLASPAAKRLQMEIGEILQSKFNYKRTRRRMNGDRGYIFLRSSPPVPTLSLPSDDR